MHEAKYIKAKQVVQEILGSTERMSGDTEADHSFRIFDTLAGLGVTDDVTLLTGLLHNLPVENTDIRNEIAHGFDPRILQNIENINKLRASKLIRETPRELNEAVIMQAYINTASNSSALVVRLADRLDNLRTAYAFPHEKRHVIAKKAEYLYAPLAKLVVLSKLASGLEEEIFKIVNPGDHYLISQYLNTFVQQHENTINDVFEFLKDVVREHVPYAYLSYRVKKPYSLYLKYYYKFKETMDVAEGLERVNDIVGVRIITKTVEECYRIESVLNKVFEGLAEYRDDYIASPRKSGYQSLHLQYKLSANFAFEVQIRTRDMHEINEFGPASHLLYKIGDKGKESKAVDKFKSYTLENEFWFKKLHYDHNLATFNEVPFAKHVYAYTPKKDIIELPQDSTLLDFAYAIHTTLGDKCIGARVNGRNVGIDYKIQNGDYIEVRTSRTKRSINMDVLKLLKTPSARAQVKKSMRKQLRED